VRVDATLELGSLADSVSVTAEVPLVDSRSSTIGALIDSRRVTELPIDGRNIVALAGILPGVADVSAPQSVSTDGGGPTISVSGSRGNQNLFLLDGTQFNALFRNTGLNFPPPDALQEVRMLRRHGTLHRFSAARERGPPSPCCRIRSSPTCRSFPAVTPIWRASDWRSWLARRQWRSSIACHAGGGLS
jgi:hypothetical protein